MQLTIPTIAAATFAATFALSPSIVSFAKEQSPIVKVSSPVKQDDQCGSPVVQIVAALRGKACA